MAGGEDRPLQRPHGALKLRRLLTVDLHAQGGPDLTHTLKGRLLGGNDGIDLPHAEIGQKVGLVDRTLGVPDIGKLGSCIRDGSRWRAFRSEEHTSELQSLMRISYAVFCLKKKTQDTNYQNSHYLYQNNIT